MITRIPINQRIKEYILQHKVATLRDLTVLGPDTDVIQTIIKMQQEGEIETTLIVAYKLKEDNE